MIAPRVGHNEKAWFPEGLLDLIGECPWREAASDGMGTSVVGKLQDGTLQEYNTQWQVSTLSEILTPIPVTILRGGWVVFKGGGVGRQAGCHPPPPSLTLYY